MRTPSLDIALLGAKIETALGGEEAAPLISRGFQRTTRVFMNLVSINSVEP